MILSDDDTIFFDYNHKSGMNIYQTLKIVYKALEKKGYNPIDQIVGYLMSGDPAYIPRVDNARNLIRRYDRDEIIEELIKNYLNKGDYKKYWHE